MMKQTIVPLGVEIPDEFTCPLSLGLMTDPVYTCDGFVYDRPQIEL